MCDKDTPQETEEQGLHPHHTFSFTKPEKNKQVNPE